MKFVFLIVMLLGSVALRAAVQGEPVTVPDACSGPISMQIPQTVQTHVPVADKIEFTSPNNLINPSIVLEHYHQSGRALLVLADSGEFNMFVADDSGGGFKLRTMGRLTMGYVTGAKPIKGRVTAVLVSPDESMLWVATNEHGVYGAKLEQLKAWPTPIVLGQAQREAEMPAFAEYQPLFVKAAGYLDTPDVPARTVPIALALSSNGQALRVTLKPTSPAAGESHADTFEINLVTGQKQRSP